MNLSTRKPEAVQGGTPPDFLRSLLENARDQIVRWAGAGDQLVPKLEAEVRRAQCLVVDVVVTNRGRTPLALSPWARLYLRFSGPDHVDAGRPIKLAGATPLWKPDDPIIAAQQERILQELDIPILQEPGGVSVNGTESVRIQYQSIDTMEVIEKRIPRLREILGLGMFSCSVELYRRLDLPK